MSPKEYVWRVLILLASALQAGLQGDCPSVHLFLPPAPPPAPRRLALEFDSSLLARLQGNSFA